MRGHLRQSILEPLFILVSLFSYKVLRNKTASLLNLFWMEARRGTKEAKSLLDKTDPCLV